MEFAPKAFRESRLNTVKRVEQALKESGNLSVVSPTLLERYPGILPILRMSTCPPIARDRLISLASVSRSLVENMESLETPRLPPKMAREKLEQELSSICIVIQKMVDHDIFVWLDRSNPATDDEVSRALTIVADRLNGVIYNPKIRSAQEERQLQEIDGWLQSHNYRQVDGVKFNEMDTGTYSYRTNIPVSPSDDDQSAKANKKVNNIPVDVVIMPLTASRGELPFLIEAKSAGDFTNVNKRRKEEAQKMTQLRGTFGNDVHFVLFLCGYFDTGYLGYEAAEGIDWVWEHRINDLELFGL